MLVLKGGAQDVLDVRLQHVGPVDDDALVRHGPDLRHARLRPQQAAVLLGRLVQRKDVDVLEVAVGVLEREGGAQLVAVGGEHALGGLGPGHLEQVEAQSPALRTVVAAAW